METCVRELTAHQSSIRRVTPQLHSGGLHMRATRCALLAFITATVAACGAVTGRDTVSSGGSGSSVEMVLINVNGSVGNTSISILGQAASSVSSPVRLTKDQPVMLMVTNNGSSSSTIKARIPVADLQVDNPTTGILGALTQTSSTVSVTVPPGPEVDVTFTPTSAGQYQVTIGGRQAGEFVVS